MTDADFRSDDARAEAEAAATVDEHVEIRDPGQIDDDDMAAAEGLTVPPEVAESYRESIERGANAQGEGRIP